ncbi:hypothetical protein GCM10027422_08450 [Hymenobacter arcticus]
MQKLLLLAAGLLALGACKKNDTAAPTPSRTDLLTAKPWRLAAQTTTSTPSSGPATTTDDYATLSACERDNFVKFNPDKTLLVDEGPTRCSASLPQTSAFTWDFNADQTKLLVASPGKANAETDDIIELSASTLHFRTAVTSSSGTVKTQDVTFTSF